MDILAQRGALLWSTVLYQLIVSFQSRWQLSISLCPLLLPSFPFPIVYSCKIPDHCSYYVSFLKLYGYHCCHISHVSNQKCDHATRWPHYRKQYLPFLTNVIIFYISKLPFSWSHYLLNTLTIPPVTTSQHRL